MLYYKEKITLRGANMSKKKAMILGSLLFSMVILSNDLNVETTVNEPTIGTEVVLSERSNENVSTVLDAYQSEDVESYREEIGNWFGPSSNQSTGIYKRKNDTIEIYVDETAQQLPTYTITRASLKDYLEGATKGKRLNRGRNVISGTQEGVIHIQNESTRITQQKTRIEIRGGITIPRFILGKMTNKDWQNEVRNHPNAPAYELVSDRVLVTGSDKTINYVKDPTKILTTKEKVIDLHDQTAGLDNSATIHRQPTGLVQHMRETSAREDYMYAYEQHTGFNYADGMRVLLDPDGSSQWGIWHELGHTYQIDDMGWEDMTEVTVNIFSMRVQKALGQRSRLEEDRVYTDIFNYLNRSQSKNFDKQDEFVRLGMFWQLELAFGSDFYPKLHQLYREESPQLWTEQDKRQHFILSASKISNKNLTPFFEKWAIEVTDDTKKELARLPKLTKKIWEYRDEMKGDVGNITDDDNNNGNTEDPSIETWDKDKVYVAGDIVMYKGVKYRAKWWNTDKVPGETIDWERID